MKLRLACILSHRDQVVRATLLGARQRYPRHDDVIKWKHLTRNWPFVR